MIRPRGSFAQMGSERGVIRGHRFSAIQLSTEPAAVLVILNFDVVISRRGLVWKEGSIWHAKRWHIKQKEKCSAPGYGRK